VSGRADHEVYIRAEEPLLTDFYARYCSGPRDIRYFTELPVDVEAIGHDGGARHVDG
jgi:hypothetical protein